jgi:hypothetical protein
MQVVISLASKQDRQGFKRRTAPYWEMPAEGRALGFQADLTRGTPGGATRLAVSFR